LNNDSVFKGFENQFLKNNLEELIETCEHDELKDYFLYILKNKSICLEAGCGSGKWVHYFNSHKIKCIGFDWSRELQKRSKQYDVDVPFDTGDLRALPYENGYFNSIVSFGAVEHSIEGPGNILREFNRVLNKNGVAVVTVPHFSVLRKISLFYRENILFLRYNNFVRKLFGKAKVTGSRKKVMQKKYNSSIKMDVKIESGGFSFYQYQYTVEQFMRELKSANFEVIKIVPAYKKYGLYENFGRLVGNFDSKYEVVRLNSIGRILNFILPENFCSHMLLAEIRR
jgi:ubiquinone/menaquinone biosynthesis C-methylase UbiE